MFEVIKDDSHITVRVTLKKRVTAKEPKVYLYTEDALAEAKKKCPHIQFSSEAEKANVASNVKGPYEAEWKFKIEEKEQEAKKEEVAKKSPEPSQEERKDLKGISRRAKLEKLNKQIQAEFSKEG